MDLSKKTRKAFEESLELLFEKTKATFKKDREFL